MANSLTVSVVARWVDQITAGARASARAVAGFAGGQRAVAAAAGGAAAAADKAAKSTTGYAASATVATAGAGTLAKATELLTSASATLTAGTVAAGEAAEATGRQQADAGRATETAGRQAETGARKFNLLERSQMRAAAASRVLKGRAEALEKQLGTLAKVSLVTDGLERAGHFLGHPIAHSVSEAATFGAGMTGFGITAEMSDAQMAPIRKAILEAAGRYGMSPEDALETFAFTRRSGVFRKPSEIIAAGGEAARFQKLAERMGSPVTGEEAAGGASSAVREYGFAATPEGIRRYYAMIDAAEKTGGGMKVSDLLQYSRSAGGLMRSFGSGNAGGLADVLAAQQVSMFLSHSGGQAGINVQDLLTTMAHKTTVRRFAKAGVNLPAFMQKAWERGDSPLEAFTDLMVKMTRGKKGPAQEYAIGHLIGNQQAGQSIMALIQNREKFRAYRDQIMGGGAVAQYDGDVNRVTNDPKTVLERWNTSKARFAIAAGQLLLPAATKLADALTKLLDFFTRFADHGGIFGKALLFAATGFAGFAIAAGAIGHVIVGVLGPLYIMRGLFKNILPMAGELAKAKVTGFAARAGGAATSLLGLPGHALSGVWGLAGRGADLAAGGVRAAARGVVRAPGVIARGAMAGVRVAAGAPAAAFNVVRAGAAGAIAMVRNLGSTGAGTFGRLANAIKGFSFSGAISGFKAMGGAMIEFARSGRLGSMAMTAFKFATRGVLAASGIGLLILAAGFLIEHWRGVVTFFQGFGKGFMKAIAPIRPALQPLINVLKSAAQWVAKLFGGGGSGGKDDWSSWGEKAGSAIGKVVLALAKVIGWIGTAIGQAVEFWSAIINHGKPPAMPPPPPPPNQVVKPPPPPAPPAGAPGAPGAKAPVHIDKMEIHNHITEKQPDPKKLAADTSRQMQATARSAAVDASD